MVTGGGLLGVEAACGLARRGLDVTLLHIMPRLMERQLEERAAALLKAAVAAKGVTVVLDAHTAAIEGEGTAERVLLKLSAEEKAKRDEHPFDAYARFRSESAKGQFPKALDNFRWRFHGLFYVAPTQNSYMCRLRIPNGILSHWQFAGVADLAERYGDPMVFGRAGEEMAALQRAGIRFDVVPGISAAQGAAASLKVSLTHRSSTRRVQFVTGHAHDGQLPEDLDLAALADPHATTAVYMLGTLPGLVARLLHAGVEPNRPVCAMFNATRPDERQLAGTMGTIVGLLAGADFAKPCILIVGGELRPRWGGNAITAAQRRGPDRIVTLPANRSDNREAS